MQGFRDDPIVTPKPLNPTKIFRELGQVPGEPGRCGAPLARAASRLSEIMSNFQATYKSLG